MKAAFGETWDKVLSEGRAVNAMDACEKFKCDAAGLNEAWGKAKVEKFGGVSYILVIFFYFAIDAKTEHALICS